MVGETNVTVIYSTGQYTISLLDRVRVRVSVDISHAHGPSIKLSLMSCGPLQSQSRHTITLLSGMRSDIHNTCWDTCIL